MWVSVGGGKLFEKSFPPRPLSKTFNIEGTRAPVSGLLSGMSGANAIETAQLLKNSHPLEGRCR
jgi:hypothetical protein